MTKEEIEEIELTKSVIQKLKKKQQDIFYNLVEGSELDQSTQYHLWDYCFNDHESYVVTELLKSNTLNKKVIDK